MKKIPYLIIAILFSSGLYAQGVYNNGAKILIGTGVSVNISGTGGNYRNETNVTNGSIDLSGTMVIAGNMTNNAVTDVLSTATAGSMVVLSGTTIQTLGGTSASSFTLPNLTVNNPAGIVIAKNALVNGLLTFNNGVVDIGNSNFTFGSLATIAGTPSATSMLVATGSGQVLKSWIAIGSFTFPVGDNTGTAEYSPVTLNFTAGTFAPGATAGVNLVNAAFADPYISGSYLNRNWNVTQTGITGFTCDASFNYPIADVVGLESEIYGVRIIPAPVSLYVPTNAALHQLTANGLTSFGAFTGALGQRTLNLTSVLLQGLYNGSGLMRQAWDAAGPHWASGVADHITVELHDATTYSTILNSSLDVPLSTLGTASLTIPATYNASYFITIKHRNSIETTTATAVSFAGSTINQSFGTPVNVFGGNLALSTDANYLIYAGDVNQDGVVDTRDYINVDNDSFNFASGYLSTDVDGNGVIDTRDFISIDNNNYSFIGTIHP